MSFNPVYSEEYICSGKIGDEIETKIYERKNNYFLHATKNWKFKIIEENYNHILLGMTSFYKNLKQTAIYITIINKETNEFSERLIESDNKKIFKLFGTCITR